MTDIVSFVDEYEKKNKVSGVLRITLKDKILLEKSFGYADRENKIPFGRDSVFSFYSLSKPFLTIGFLQLVDKGMINLDDHPGKYVPEAAGFDARVTFRNMLHHASGLPDFMQSPGASERFTGSPSADIRDELKALSTFPQYFAPGTGVMYANINMTIPALAIENVTGVSYAEYMSKNVFAPLGMKTAQVDREGLYVKNRVKGYTPDGDGNIVPTERRAAYMLGGGDIVGTVDDVYRLNLAIKHRMLLRPETWEQALTPGAEHFGMGCRVSEWHGKKRITHNGGHVGFRTFHVQLTEDDFDIIILSNSGFGRTREDMTEAAYGYYYGDDGIPQEKLELDKGYI